RGQAVQKAPGDGRDVREPGRNIRRGYVAPSHHRAIVSQRQTVIATRGDGGDVHQPGWYVGLVRPVVAPGDHGAVAAQGQTMSSPTRDGRDVGQPGRNV